MQIPQLNLKLTTPGNFQRRSYKSENIQASKTRTFDTPE